MTQIEPLAPANPEQILQLGAPGQRLPDARWRAFDIAGGTRDAKREGGSDIDHRGGLIVGSTVYGVISAYLVARLGPLWAHHGTCESRFLKPIYDGEMVAVAGEITEVAGDASAGSITVTAWIEGPDGDKRASGVATVAWPTPEPPVLFDGRPLDGLPAPGDRTLTGDALVGTFLRPVEIDPGLPDGEGIRDLLSGDLVEGDSPSSLASYFGATTLEGADGVAARGDEATVHPGWFVTASNLAQGHSIETTYKKAFPGVHAGVTVTNFGEAALGRPVRVLARRKDVYENRGRTFVEYEVAIVQENVPIARVMSRSIRAVSQG